MAQVNHQLQYNTFTQSMSQYIMTFHLLGKAIERELPNKVWFLIFGVEMNECYQMWSVSSVCTEH